MAFGAQALAQALRDAVLAQGFEQTEDSLLGGAAVDGFPSLDLAVAAFPAGAAPVFANVLFSREHPQGLVAELGADAGAPRNLRYLADLQDAEGRSIAWLPGADWSALPWQPLCGQGAQRVVAPYPASLLKLMVLVGVARLVDAGRCSWGDALDFEGQQRAVRDWAFDMTVISCNRSTSALVALLHRRGAILREGRVELYNELHDTFSAYGLPGLRLANTRPDGGWGNAAGAGVGQLQMTAWDTLRLLWLLDRAAPPPPWLPAGMPPLLSAASQSELLYCLQEQGLHEVLSSSVLAGLPNWQPGLPARLPLRWIARDGSAQVGPHRFPGDLSAQAGLQLQFAHKTGNTENYGADAGIVRGIAPARRHYLIALTSNLGRRYATQPHCVSNWRLPALGAAVDARLCALMGR